MESRMMAPAKWKYTGNGVHIKSAADHGFPDLLVDSLDPCSGRLKKRGFWWVVSDLEGDLDVDELVKRVGTSLRVK